MFVSNGRALSWRVPLDSPPSRRAVSARPSTAPEGMSRRPKSSEGPPRAAEAAHSLDSTAAAAAAASPLQTSPTMLPRDRAGDSKRRAGGALIVDAEQWAEVVDELVVCADRLFQSCADEGSSERTVEVLRALNTITHDFRILSDKISARKRIVDVDESSAENVFAATPANSVGSPGVGRKAKVTSSNPVSPKVSKGKPLLEHRPRGPGSDDEAQRSRRNVTPSAWRRGPPKITNAEQGQETLSSGSRSSSPSRSPEQRRHAPSRENSRKNSAGSTRDRRERQGGSDRGIGSGARESVSDGNGDNVIGGEAGWLSPGRRRHSSLTKTSRGDAPKSSWDEGSPDSTRVKLGDPRPVKERLASPLESPSRDDLSSRQEKADQLRREYKETHIIEKVKRSQQKHREVRERAKQGRDQRASEHQRKMTDAAERAEKHLNDIRNRARSENAKVSEALFIQNLSLQNAKSELDLKLQRSEDRRRLLMQQKSEKASLNLRSPTASDVREAPFGAETRPVTPPQMSQNMYTGDWADATSETSASDSEFSIPSRSSSVESLRSSDVEVKSEPTRPTTPTRPRSRPATPGSPRNEMPTPAVQLEDVFSEETKTRWKALGTQVMGTVGKDALCELRQRKKDAGKLKSRTAQELFRHVHADKITESDATRIQRLLGEMPPTPKTAPEKHDEFLFASVALASRDDKILQLSPNGKVAVSVAFLQYVLNHAISSPEVCSLLISSGSFYTLLQSCARRIVSTDNENTLEAAVLAAKICSEVCKFAGGAESERACDCLFAIMCAGMVHKIRFCLMRLASASLGSEKEVRAEQIVSLLQFVRLMVEFLQRSDPTSEGEISKSLFAILKETDLCGCVSVLVTVLLPLAEEQQSLRRAARYQGTPTRSPLRTTGPVFPGNLDASSVQIAEAGLELLAAISATTQGRSLAQSTLGTDAGGAAQLEFFHVIRTLVTFAHDKNVSKRVIDLVLLFLGQYTLCCPSNQDLLCWGTPTMLQTLCSSLPVRYFCDVQGREIFFPTLLAFCSPAREGKSALRRHSVQRILSQYFDFQQLRDFVKARTTHEVLSDTAPLAQRVRERWSRDCITRVSPRFRAENRVPRELWASCLEILDREEDLDLSSKSD